MAYISVTNNFSNGTVANADDVDTNFANITDGLSDGTKDLNMMNATFAGTFVVNGNTTIGNAAADSMTVNASPTFAATMVVSAPCTFNQGVSIGTGASFTTAGNARFEGNLQASGTVSSFGYSYDNVTGGGGTKNQDLAGISGIVASTLWLVSTQTNSSVSRGSLYMVGCSGTEFGVYPIIEGAFVLSSPSAKILRLTNNVASTQTVAVNWLRIS